MEKLFKIKGLFLSVMLVLGLGLTACGEKSDNPTVQADSSQNDFNSLRSAYQRQCVHSGGNPADNSPEKQKFAENMCACVYDEGIKAYGSESAWADAARNFDPKQNNPKFKQITDQAVEICMKRHGGSQNQATSSSASSAKP